MNKRIYSLLLRRYPATLREDFGPEMMRVFLDDMGDNGAARVWWRPFKELCQTPLWTPRATVPLVPALTAFMPIKVHDSEVPDRSPLTRR